ncbi:MAG2-interacting protein 2 [Silene latifolia]|uniref:MAG2-interacting protein 2 n=1 Tax=Silene latifolia TaxID=37657 RepID=UPI003D781E2A
MASEILYETRNHATGPCFPNYPPRQVSDNANKGVLSSLLSSKGLTQIKEKWTGYRQPKKLKRSVSLFVSPNGVRVAVAVANRVTILQKADDYQLPCGTFTSSSVDAFTHGVWSESHDVLGIVDDVETLYFIRSNGEEITRIELRRLKVSSQIVGLFVADDSDIGESLLCTFNFLTSDGTLHQIEISQDLDASLSSKRTWNDIKRQLPLNFFSLDYSFQHSLLVVVGGGTSLTAGSNTASCSLSLWHWSQNSELQQLCSTQFEGVYCRSKGFSGELVSPKVLISPQGKFIGALDLNGCLNIFKLDDNRSSLSLCVSGETGNNATTSNTYSADTNLFDDVIDFTWWSDHVCSIVKKGGTSTMTDVISRQKLLDNELMFSLAVMERAKHILGKVFVLDVPLAREDLRDRSETRYVHDIGQYTEGHTNKLSRLSWRLLSFSERSVPEMYDILIDSQSYESALVFAERHKLDKDKVFKSQWLHSEQGIDEIQLFLSKIKDEAYILGECAENVGHTEDAVRALLSFGLNLTNRYKFSQAELDRSNLIWDFRLSRLQLLLFKDRLETFLGINMGRFSVQEYSKFRVMPMNEAAVKLAESGKIGALNLMFKRHPFSLCPSILNILGSIPETIPVQTYSQLLPGKSPPSTTVLRDKDWVECEDMVEYIRNLPENDERVMLIRTEPIIKQLSGISWPSTNEILLWYKDRAREIDTFSGQLENSICLLDYGCRKGMHELQQFLDDVSYLQQLIYSEGSDDEIHCPISLTDWERFSEYEKFKTMLKGVKEENIIERLRVRAIPFMESKRRSPTASLASEHQQGESYIVRWLKDVTAQNNIEFCSVVIDEWCRDTQSGIFVDEAEAVDCALQCIYLCSATDRWNTMASILSKLPNIRGVEPRFDGLEKRLKLAEGHIEAGRLLALYQVPKPVNFFLEAHNDDKAVKQILRLILSKFARRQPGHSDNDWTNMWRDLQCLQEKAFPFVDLEYILMEFCRGVLKAGRFSLARNYLKGAGAVSLSTDKAESLVIQTAREYFFSASSLSSSEIWKAKDCLDLFPSSPNVRLEADTIEAVAVKLPNLGVNLLPVQFKQIKDPMEIIKMAITSQAGAYLNVDELIEVAKLLGLSSQEDISAVQEAIAREAAVAGDLQLAFDLCLVLARKGYGHVWDLCAALAKGLEIENMDLNSRKQLLSFALCHCDDESIGDLLHAWKDLDLKAQSESLMMQSGTTPNFNDDQEAHLKKVKVILSKVAKDLPVANGTTWDDFLRENGKVALFANLQLPWLLDLSCRSELGKTFYSVSVPGKQYVSVRCQAVITILSWLARSGFAPRDDLISSLAKSIMEPPVTEEEDIIGCSFLLNLVDAFHGVEVIEQQLKVREDYQEISSIMNAGMTYSILHNSGAACKDPYQRRDLLRAKFQEKINSDELEKVDKEQSAFWRGWKLKLEEQKLTADRTKVLEELIPGVETERFLSGDLDYISSVVMSFIESVKLQKKSILSDLLTVAETYSLNRTEVLLKFLTCVLVSEAWSNEAIDAEISEFKAEVLNSAEEIIELLTSAVYPVVDECNKARMAYIFTLLSDCYLHLDETKDLRLLVTKHKGDSFEKLAQFYRLIAQECDRVSFITDLNFKNIVDINAGNLDFKHFNSEVCRHVNESTVELLAKMVQNLTAIPSAIPHDLLSWPDVYMHHVQTMLEKLEERAKLITFQNPESVQSLLSELEQTYHTCRKHVKILDHQVTLVIMNQFFNGIIPLHVPRESMSSDSIGKDCLLVLMNFWTRLYSDLLDIAENSEEKSTAFCIMGCFKIFMRLLMDENVTPTQGWDTVYYFANHVSLTSPAEDFSFCRAMVLSGCGFDSNVAVFAEAQCSIEPRVNNDVCDLYLNTLESILSNLVYSHNERLSFQNLLSSLSRTRGDFEVLQTVRVKVWERIACFSDNLQLPSHVRVYVLEVMQSISQRNMKVSTNQLENVLFWEGWEEWSSRSKGSDLKSNASVDDQSDGPNRFKNRLVALRTSELATSISSEVEITADDLLTINSAVSCFLKLCEVADRHAHLEALTGILVEWESLFLEEKSGETSMEASGTSEGGNNWSDDWDEGWDSFQDEEPVQKPSSECSSPSVNPLHKCWLEILKKFAAFSHSYQVVKLLDQSLKKPNILIISEDDAKNLCDMLIGSDCFMALKIALLLPYEALQLHYFDIVEEKLKQGGFPESNCEKDFLILVLSSGIFSTIITKSSLGSIFSYICYLVGNYSRQCQDTQLARVNQPSRNGEDDEAFFDTFRKVLFPCFVSELVKADQQILAGLLVTKFMNTNPSLCLVNIAEVGLKRFLQNHLQLLEGQSTTEERYPEMLRCTFSNLIVRLRTLLHSALSSLPNSS